MAVNTLEENLSLFSYRQIKFKNFEKLLAFSPTWY